MRPVKTGKGVRMTFSRQKEVLEMPNLIEIQKNSYQWFLDEGLKEVFADISPITDFALQPFSSVVRGLIIAWSLVQIQ